jgi:hypothetical protein
MKNRKIYLISSTLTAFILVFATLLPWQPRPTQAATNNPAWSTPVTINDDNLPARHQKNPDMVVMDELGIYVVWEDYRNSNSDPDIYFTRSTDEGVTWSANTQVNGDSLSINNDPHIAVDASGTIYVVWLVTVGENGVYFARSVDGGLTWSPSRKIWNWPSLVTTNSPTSPDTDDGTKLDLAADTRAGREGHIHMAWTQDYNEEYTKVGINYATSSNGGDSWNPKKRIAEGIPGWELRAYNLGMAFYHGDIYIAWENAFGNHDQLDERIYHPQPRRYILHPGCHRGCEWRIVYHLLRLVKKHRRTLRIPRPGRPGQKNIVGVHEICQPGSGIGR